MDRAQLLRYFDTLAETPESVVKLRNFVLHLATRGMLVQQDSADEPATELAKRITALGQRFAKEQKMKLPTPEVAIAEADKRFHLPVGWAWMKLGDLCVKLGAGSTPLGGKRIYQDSGVKFLRSQNVWNEGLYLDDVALIAPKVHEDMDSTCVEPGDVLLNITGASIGRSAVVPDDFDEANVSQHVAIVRLADKELRQFIHLIIIAPEFQSQIMQVQVGVSREGLSMKNLKEFVIALPPLAEQHRIVAKVEELLALCDELEARQTDAREHRAHLVRSALDHLTNAQDESDFKKHSAFCLQHSELLFDSVPALRQAIRSLAVQGKLLPQNAKQDGTAEQALNERRSRMKANGAPRKKSRIDFEAVDEAHVPMTVPENWKWIRFGEVAERLEYGTSEKAFPHAKGVPTLRMGNVQDGKLDFGNLKYVPHECPDLPKLFLDDGDIIFNRTNSADLVGKAAVFRGKPKSFTLASYLIRVSLDETVASPDFFNLAINSTYYRLTQIEPELTQQCGQANFSGSKLANSLVPLPPRPEQQRIVAKVDELMRWCDALEARLSAARTHATHLLDATLHQFLKPVL